MLVTTINCLGIELGCLFNKDNCKIITNDLMLLFHGS